MNESKLRELSYYFCGECNIRYSKEYIKNIGSFNKIGGIICPQCKKSLRYKKKNSIIKKIS